ncbi:MAG: molybdopterin-synthase adenylyltransferase MoeB [Gammaproteobacteria bacterium]
MDDQTLLRYSRQILLPEIDIAGQERLGAARALIIGLGGLGSPIVLYLAAAGVGHLTLVDFDAVEVSNLQRQIVHGMADLGRAKVESARDAIHAINPSIQVATIGHALDDAELASEVERADVVIDASDNLATRLAINGACVRAYKPLVIGAAIRFEGQVLVYRPDQPDSPCYRCLYRSDENVAETCSQAGVMAPMLGIVGSIQALEAIKLVTGAGVTLSGRLLVLDGLRMEWRVLTVKKNSRCPACSVA